MLPLKFLVDQMNEEGLRHDIIGEEVWTSLLLFKLVRSRAVRYTETDSRNPGFSDTDTAVSCNKIPDGIGIYGRLNEMLILIAQ